MRGPPTSGVDLKPISRLWRCVASIAIPISLRWSLGLVSGRTGWGVSVIHHFLVRWPPRSLHLFALSSTSGVHLIGTTCSLPVSHNNLTSTPLRRGYTCYVAFSSWMSECTILVTFGLAFNMVAAGHGVAVVKLWLICNGNMENGRWRRGADSKMLRYIPHTSTSKKNGKVYPQKSEVG